MPRLKTKTHPLSLAITAQSVSSECELHRNLREQLIIADTVIELTSGAVAWKQILDRRWDLTILMRKWRDMPVPPRPELSDLPNSGAAKDALRKLWDWSQKTVARLLLVCEDARPVPLS